MDGSDYFAGSVPILPGSQLPSSARPAGQPGTATTLSADEQAMLTQATATSWEHMTGTPSTYSPSAKLGFSGSIRVGLQLAGVCWRVLTSEASLLLVPAIVSLISVVAVVGYSDAIGGFDRLVTADKYATAIRVFPLLAVVMMVSVVGQAVIVAAATERLSGGYLSLGGAWARAAIQLPRLLFFGLIYAVERTLTSLLRGRRRWSPGTIAADTIDRAWDFATYLAIPVILYENLSAFKAVARSGQLVAKRWGVQLTAGAVIGIALFVCSLPLIALGILAVGAGWPVLGIALIVFTLVGQAVMSATLTGVLSAALYRFATSGAVAPGFSTAEMWAPFSRR